MVRELVTAFRQLLPELERAPYFLADTRIRSVSLYDHLALTAGIAVAMAQELRCRGLSTEDVCGLALPDGEFRALVRLCGLIHDIGKARLGETEYRWHVERGCDTPKSGSPDATFPRGFAP